MRHLTLESGQERKRKSEGAHKGSEVVVSAEPLAVGSLTLLLAEASCAR